jgi:hypothetical protein
MSAREKEEPRGGQVLPSGARPQGYSLEDMARLVGQFTINGNNPNSVPKTPFRILFTASWGPECFPLTDSAAWRKYSAISLKWFRDLDFDATSKIPIFH